MKTIEQRIAERAEAELKSQISMAVGCLRALLAGDEEHEITELVKTSGLDIRLQSVGQLLDHVESEVFNASRQRHCDYAIDAALDELQHRIYPQHAIIQGQMPTMPQFPVQETVRRGN